MDQPKEHLSITAELLLAKSLLDWRENPDMSFRRLFRLNFSKSVMANKPLTSSQLLDFAITNTLSNLLRQTFVCNYEFLRNNIDDKMSSKLKNLRNETSSATNNLNTSKFMDVIRQSLVHNDITQDIPNWRLTDNYQVEINFKGNLFTFDLYQFHIIMNEFLYLKKQQSYLTFDIKQQELSVAIHKSKLSPKNIHEYISLYYPNNVRETLDSYQRSAIYNLFTDDRMLLSIARLLNVANNNYFIFQKMVPLKHNAGHISYINNMCFRSLIQLRKSFISRHDYLSQASDFEYDVNLIDESNKGEQRVDLLNFIQNDTIAFEATILSNALFTMFSIVSPNNIAPYFNGFDININSLRNSIMHGRYYYDCDNGFEFYDGKNNSQLEHIATLSINDIFKIIGKYVQDNVQTQHTQINE